MQKFYLSNQGLRCDFASLLTLFSTIYVHTLAAAPHWPACGTTYPPLAWRAQKRRSQKFLFKFKDFDIDQRPCSQSFPQDLCRTCGTSIGGSKGWHYTSKLRLIAGLPGLGRHRLPAWPGLPKN
jgi:hypothetical protein